MKKYKLIKQYPNSPEIGTIVHKTKEKNYEVVSDNIFKGILFGEITVQNYPEFWEEVKEKEYTILSFISTGDGRIRNRVEPNSYFEEETYISENGGCNYPLKSMLYGNDSIGDGGQKIHSVRRESDGQIFTLGESITDGQSKGVIKEFEIGEHILGGMYVCIGDGIKMSINHIRFLPKRKPILITEDGVEIFEGDKYWWTDNDFKCISAFAGEGKSLVPDAKRFSSEEKCEEYIKWNKPMYSLNDVTRAIFNANTDDDIIKELEKLGRK